MKTERHTPGPVEFTGLRVISGHAGGFDRKLGLTVEIKGKSDTVAQAEDALRETIARAPTLLRERDELRAALDAVTSDPRIRSACVEAPDDVRATLRNARAVLARAGGAR